MSSHIMIISRRLQPKPRDPILDCGGKRSATPLLGRVQGSRIKSSATRHSQNGVAAALCPRGPNSPRKLV